MKRTKPTSTKLITVKDWVRMQQILSRQGRQDRVIPTFWVYQSDGQGQPLPSTSWRAHVSLTDASNTKKILEQKGSNRLYSLRVEVIEAVRPDHDSMGRNEKMLADAELPELEHITQVHLPNDLTDRLAALCAQHPSFSTESVIIALFQIVESMNLMGYVDPRWKCYKSNPWNGIYWSIDLPYPLNKLCRGAMSSHGDGREAIAQLLTMAIDECERDAGLLLRAYYRFILKEKIRKNQLAQMAVASQG